MESSTELDVLFRKRGNGMNKCYLIFRGYEIGKIEECEIIKETEKTFVIYRKQWGKATVKKSEMSCIYGDIRFTYNDALLRVEEIIKMYMVMNKAKIEKLKEEQTSLMEKLCKVYAEIEVQDHE